MQDDNTSIEESMKLYERGVEVIKELNAYLETAENKIKQISRLDKEN
jgi:exodeoxyribonuclease VII small subunit